jgi:hypothetical protein
MKGITVLKEKKIPDCYWSTYGTFKHCRPSSPCSLPFFNRNRFSFLEFSSVFKNKKKDEGMMKQVEREMNLLLEPNSLSCSNRLKNVRCAAAAAETT